MKTSPRDSGRRRSARGGKAPGGQFSSRSGGMAPAQVQQHSRLPPPCVRVGPVHVRAASMGLLLVCQTQKEFIKEWGREERDLYPRAIRHLPPDLGGLHGPSHLRLGRGRATRDGCPAQLSLALRALLLPHFFLSRGKKKRKAQLDSVLGQQEKLGELGELLTKWMHTPTCMHMHRYKTLCFDSNSRTTLTACTTYCSLNLAHILSLLFSTLLWASCI